MKPANRIFSLLIAWTVLTAMGPSGGQAAEAPTFAESTGSFPSGGKKIEVQRFVPKGDGKRPAILVLHGADGFTLFNGAHYQAMAKEMAGHGYAVYLVHYFDRTGTKFADFKTCVTNFPAWLQVIDEAVTYVGQQPGVDARRIGLLGMSLGAFLSLAYATESRRVEAVVEFFGGLPAPFVPKLRRLPPTLILHGAKDRVVPVEEAEKLEKLLKEKKLPHEIKIYPTQDHGFTGDDLKDSLRRTATFFAAHLRKKGGE